MTFVLDTNILLIYLKNHPTRAFLDETYAPLELPEKPLSLSARNMGKNGLWIAATASVTDSTLLTTDNDFDHLNGIFLNVEKVKLMK